MAPMDRDAYQKLLAEFKPAPENKEAHALLETWTKYEVARDVDGEKVRSAKLGDAVSLVLVRRPDKGTLSVVMRQLVDVVPLSDGKTLNKYEILGLRPVESIEQGKELLVEATRAYNDRILGDAEGFGTTPADEVADARELIDF